MAKIVTKEQPYTMVDFRQGRYSPNQVSTFLAPQNSVSHSKNINFDTIVGSAVVRNGTTKLGLTVSAIDNIPQGFAEFVGPHLENGIGTPNVLIVAFSGVTSATTAVYAYTGGNWVSSNLSGMGNFKIRFQTFGGLSFLTSAHNGMYSSPDGTVWSNSSNNNCMFSADARPTLIWRYKARLLAAGDTTYPDRVFFSSIIDPTSSPFITWNPDPVSGDWIDVNPDDGGNVTGFSENSTFLLVFRNTGMYRMDTVSKTVDPDNIFNVGAVSQEAIVLCQGVTYFFSGQDIRRTNGGYPEQISRAGVQDIIEAIPISNTDKICAGTDGLSVWFSVGNVTLNANQDNEFVIANCTLKFSPRDQSWSVHSYGKQIRFFEQFTLSAGRYLRAATTSGDVQTIDLGTTDDGAVINFELESQDIDFGQRSSLKQLSDKLIVYMNNGVDSQIQFRMDGLDVKDVNMSLNQRVNISNDLDMKGNFFNFRWFGNSKGTAPSLQGYELHDVTALGETTTNG